MLVFERKIISHLLFTPWNTCCEKRSIKRQPERRRVWQRKVMNVSGLLTRWRQFGRRTFGRISCWGWSRPVSACLRSATVTTNRAPRSATASNHNPSKVNFSRWRCWRRIAGPALPSTTGISTPFAPLFVISPSQWRRRRCRWRKKLPRCRLSIWRCSTPSARC